MKMRTIALFAIAIIVSRYAFAEDNEPAVMFEKVIARYKAMQTYKAEGPIVSDIDARGMNISTETSFSMKLKTPNLYLFSWTQKNMPMPGMSQSGAVWNAGGKPHLYMGMMNAYSRIANDEVTFSAVTGIYGGAAFTSPSLLGGILGGRQNESSEAQTKAVSDSQVRNAVNSYFGGDVAKNAAHQQLRTWGNLALPYLRRMASEPGIEQNAWSLICSIKELGTTEAIDCLIDIAAGKTSIDGGEAVSVFGGMFYDMRDKAYLRNHPKFKETIFNLASHESWLCRGQVAAIMGKMGWKDGLPLLKEMLKDNNLSLRENAAEAIEQLTGEKVSLRRPQVAFPKTELVADLINLLGQLPKSGWMSSAVSFDQWFDKSRGLLRWGGISIGLYSRNLEPGSSVHVDKMSHDFLMIPYDHEESQLVCLVSDEQKPIAEYAVSLDSKGKELWQYRPATSGIRAIAPLYHKKGEIGGVILGLGGAEGIVAVNPQGERLWNIPNYFVMYELKTCPSLPSRIVACGGSIDIFDEKGKPVHTTSSKSKMAHFYAHHIEMFADEQNKLSIIATGSGDKQRPMVVRYNEALEPVWTISLSHEARALAMLEPPGKERLFVVATDSGELLIFNQDGTLKQQVTLPGAKGSSYPIYGMKAGLLGDKKYALSIGIVSSVLIYEIRM